MSTEKEFVISRVFDASRDLVFSAWTESDHLMQWFGPKGSRMVSCKNDLRPGGTLYYGMEMPGGGVMWGKWTFREIDKPKRLVVVISFSDKEGNITQHPMNPNWPKETLATTTFEEQGKKTKVTIRWSPLNATDIERKTFDEGHEGMQKGWTGTLDQLEAYLAKG